MAFRSFQERPLNTQDSYETYGLKENPLQFIYTGNDMDGSKKIEADSGYHLRVAPTSPLKPSHRFDSPTFNDEQFEEPFWMTFLIRYCLKALSCDPPKNSTVISKDWLQEFKIPIPVEEVPAVENGSDVYLEPWPQASASNAFCDSTNLQFILIEDGNSCEIEPTPSYARRTEIIEPQANINFTPIGKQQRGKKRKFDDSWTPGPSQPSGIANGFDPSLPLSNYMMEAFKENGTGTDRESRLRLCHTHGKTISFSCLVCPNVPTFPKFSQLAKHIEFNHCPNKLMCLLCKLDDKGCCPRFNSTDEAFLHAMECHHNESRYFICDFCELLFSCQEALDFHLTQSHSNENLPDTTATMRRYPCLLCLFPFKQSGHRKDHFRQNHGMNVELAFPKKTKSSSTGFMGPLSKKKKHDSSTENRTPAKPQKENKLKSFNETSSKHQMENKLKSFNETSSKPQMEKKSKHSVENEKKSVEVITKIKILKSTESKLNVSKPVFLRRDLKDKYADILKRQPRVCLIDISKDDRQFKSVMKRKFSVNHNKNRFI